MRRSVELALTCSRLDECMSDPDKRRASVMEEGEDNRVHPMCDAP